MTNLNFLQFLQDKAFFPQPGWLFYFCPLVIWMIESLHAGMLVHIDDSVIIILSAFMTSKVVQKFAEKPADPAVEDVQLKTTPAMKMGSTVVVPATATR